MGPNMSCSFDLVGNPKFSTATEDFVIVSTNLEFLHLKKLMHLRVHLKQSDH
jgi:hypothetical protein